MISPIMEEKNYSKCPLKKRPVNLSFENEDTDLSDHEIREEPQNLTVKKEVVAKSPVEVVEMPEVAIKHEFKHELNNNDSFVHNQNTPLVVMPTPTYPNLALRPWSFHIPYTPDFYRNIHHPQPHPLAAYQSPPHPISPLRGDLHSPSSPSEGSISPPPSYLHGRSSSLSPPIRTDVMYPAMMVRNSHVIKPEVVGTHRFIPYQLPAYKPYELNLSQQSPVSPSYSERSFFSMRSHSPDSNCSTPEDLSVKSLSTSPAHYSHHNHHSHHSSHSSPVSSSTSVSSLLPEISDRRSVSESREKSSSKSGPPRHQCQDCNKSYSTFSGLTKHRQFHCPAAEGNQVKKSFSCKDCDKTYVSLGALKMHIRTHTLPCKCTICGKAFSRPWLLQGHIRTHTGEKPFSCQHCHRAFADRSNLRAHLQTHSDIKKYSCPTCSKTFSRMSLLTKHADGGCPGMQMSPGPALPPFLPPQYTSSSSDRQPQDIVAAY